MTYYDILGVATTASKDEIRKAYLQLVQQFHPDKSPNVSPSVKKLVEEKFKDIQEAYEILSKHRAAYDNQLRAVAPPPSQTTASTPPPPTQAPPVTPPVPPATKWTSQQWIKRLAGLVFIYTIIWAWNSPDPKPLTPDVPHNAVNVPAPPPITEWQKKRDQVSDEAGTGVSVASRSVVDPAPSRRSTKHTEQFGGTIYNQSANISSSFAVVVQNVGGVLSGCMGVKPPLFGSGPVSGQAVGADVSFVVTSAIGRITFVGLRSADTINGTYRVEHESRPTELGTFTVAKVTSEEPVDGSDLQNCPTDAEVHQQKTSYNSVTPNLILTPASKVPMSTEQAAPNDLPNQNERSRASGLEQQLGTIAKAPEEIWKNLRDGFTYRILFVGDNLILESVETDPADLAAIVRCQFKRAMSVGIIWIGTCRKRNPRYRSESESNSAITLFSDSRIEGSDFVLIPKGSSPEETTPKTTDQQSLPTRPDLSRLSVPEQQSIEAACSQAKYLEGPAAYNRCLEDQLARLSRAPRRPDLSRLSGPEEQSIEAACSQAKYLEGPAAYNRCLVNQLGLLSNHRP